MAIKAKPRLQPQTVARAKADGHHFWLIQKQLRKIKGLAVGHRNLEPILAGISGPRHPDRRTLPVQHGHIHEPHPGHLGQHPRQRRLGLRPLQRQERAACHELHLGHIRQMGAHMGHIRLLAGGIDHDEQMIAPVGEHQIIQDAAGAIGEQPIALPPRRQSQHIHRHHRLERQTQRRHPGNRAQDHLPHVTDIKQTRRLARVQMFLHHPRRILHRHLIAREWHHLAAKVHMQIVQPQSLQVGHNVPPSSKRRLQKPIGTVQTG